jgi:hypothetical protein
MAVTNATGRVAAAEFGQQAGGVQHSRTRAPVALGDRRGEQASRVNRVDALKRERRVSVVLPSALGERSDDRGQGLQIGYGHDGGTLRSRHHSTVIGMGVQSDGKALEESCPALSKEWTSRGD